MPGNRHMTCTLSVDRGKETLFNTQFVSGRVHHGAAPLRRDGSRSPSLLRQLAAVRVHLDQDPGHRFRLSTDRRDLPIGQRVCLLRGIELSRMPKADVIPSYSATCERNARIR